jgi:hypothetical protein
MARAAKNAPVMEPPASVDTQDATAAVDTSTASVDTTNGTAKATGKKNRASKLIIETLSINDLTLDPNVQPRETISSGLISEYADAMKSGATFPAIRVFREGDTNRVADGWHRVLAARQAGHETLDAEINVGGLRDAIVFSLSANETHGLRRTDADKRKAVLRVLNDDEWSKLSSSAIAKMIKVSQPFVGKIRREIGKGGAIVETSDGRIQNTANLGRPRREPEAETATDQDSPAESVIDISDVLDDAPTGLPVVPSPESPDADPYTGPQSANDEDDEDDEEETGRVALDEILSEDEGLTELVSDPTAQFGEELLALMGKIGSFGPEQVFEALDSASFSKMVDRWQDFISAIDNYSTVLEKRLA